MPAGLFLVSRPHGRLAPDGLAVSHLRLEGFDRKPVLARKPFKGHAQVHLALPLQPRLSTALVLKHAKTGRLPPQDGQVPP